MLESAANFREIGLIDKEKVVVGSRNVGITESQSNDSFLPGPLVGKACRRSLNLNLSNS